MCHIKQPPLLKVIPDNLQPHGQPAHRGDGDGHARQAGEVGGNRVDVVQVHGHRVVGLGAEWEGGGRAGGAQDDVHLLEGAAEVVADEVADLLGLEVVGVVVAGGEDVGSDHDAPLDLGAEPLGAAALVKVGEVLGLRAAVAVAHAVEAGEAG